MALISKILIVFALSFLCFGYTNAATVKEALEWRVETDLKKLERLPLYAGEKSPFPVKKKPKPIAEIKREKPKELTASQKKALEASEVLKRIRTILNGEEIFNADVSDIAIGGIIEAEGVRSVLIKNRWYEEGALLDVPIAAKEYLMDMIDQLTELDPKVAEIVAGQVEEKIEAVRHLSLKIAAIREQNILLIDDAGNEHVIGFETYDF